MTEAESTNQLLENYSFSLGTPADAEAIGHLHALSWQRHYRGILPDQYLDQEVVDERTSVWRKRFSSPDPAMHVIKLNHREEFIGFSGFFLDQHEALGTYIDNLHVLQEHQGKGLGHLLMKRTAASVLKLGELKVMYLHVFEANKSASSFYERIGGKVVGQQIVPCPGGVERLVIDYAWTDLEAFVAN